MIPNLEEKDVETVEENIFESGVSINMSPCLITILDDFKDDKESLGERVRGFTYSLRCRYVKEDITKGALYNLEKHKCLSSIGGQMWDITVNIVEQKTGASDVVFSEATLLPKTFSYRKLIGRESGGRVRGVGLGLASNQLNAKRNCQIGTEPLDSSIASLLLKAGDNVEENQRNNTLLAGEHIRDTLATTPTLAKNYEAYIKDPNFLQGVNKFCATQISKKHISMKNRMEIPQLACHDPIICFFSYCNFYVDDQNTSMRENPSSCSKQPNIT
ncbi:LOW QUALITY PROTEIN: hypothetical protein Cgig2_011540 [Carnegiea gigantea]|uniref:Uncharacterized protein n=1 Tax=Carnegiea gigantea TaxID=171969 RepID=A0A9Q1K3V0_9CARY|nr:LOW QUALITY PROTEIN: hypothetical protein Cgig2_011540 [Carnegiea gigantea]